MHLLSTYKIYLLGLTILDPPKVCVFQFRTVHCGIIDESTGVRFGGIVVNPAGNLLRIVHEVGLKDCARIASLLQSYH